MTFDLDGTLYSLGWAKFWFALRHPGQLRFVAAMGKARESLRHEGRQRNDFWPEMDRRTAGALRWPIGRVEQARQRFLERDLPWAAGMAGPCAGLRPLLERMVDAGLRLALISDYPIAAKLAALRLDDLPWVAQIDGSALGALKPLPLVFERALEILRLPPSQVVHIGDRIDADIDGARALGMAARLLGRGRPESFASYRQLEDAFLESR